MYKKKKNGVVGIVVTVIVLILLVILSNIKIENLTFVENVFSTIVMPFQNGFTMLKNKISGNNTFFTDLDNLKSENDELKQKNSELEQSLRELEIIKAENTTLKEQLNLKEKYGEYNTVSGYVINRDISNYTGMVVINVGSDDGVQPNMTVIADKGLVGNVVSVTSNTAKVQTIVDPASSVSCIISTSKDAFITKGSINIKNVRIEHIIPIVYKLEEMGCEITLKEKEIGLISKNRLKACNIKTMPYPGFPTDMQPIISSALGVAKGTSIVVENIFENRYKYLSELKRMGAKVAIEGRTAIIKGIKRYDSAKVEATDLRGGAALILAALNANGKTVVSNIGYILRGYENIDEKLRKLGANIYLREGE